MTIQTLLLSLSLFCFLGTAEQNHSETELIEGAGAAVHQKIETQTEQKKQLPANTSSAQTKTNKNSTALSTEVKVSNKTKKEIEGAGAAVQKKIETQTEQKKQPPSDTSSAQTKTNKNSTAPSTEVKVSNKTKKEIEGAGAAVHQKIETQTEQKKQPPSDTSSAQTKINKNPTALSTEVKVSNKTKKESDAFFERKISIEDVSNGGRFLELGLEYPINFGIHLKYLISDSAYARLGLGFMPSFFLDSFQKLSPSFGYLNEEEAKLISDTFKNSMYIDFRLAWSPYLKESGGGPYLEIGLSRMLYGKGELKGSHLSKVIPDNSFNELSSYSAKTNTYNATAHIGYQIPFEKVKLNIEVGLIKILTTNILSEKSSITSKLLTEKQKLSFKNFLKKKGWIFPTISGWISFSF